MNKLIITTLLAGTVSLAPASVLITSVGAWDSVGVIASSNGGIQANSNSSGTFGANGANAYYASNGSGDNLTMQTATGNPQQNYTAGYTYTYQATSYAALLPNHNDNQNVQLIAGGSLVSGTLVTGANNLGAVNSPVTIQGSYAVASGNANIGQRIGIQLFSDGIQSRWLNDGSTTLSALLTEHLGFDGGNGAGALYSTAIAGGAQTTAFDHILDMSLALGGATVEANYVRFNNNATTQQSATFGSATDTFRAGTSYQIIFDANQAVINDSTQDSLNIVLGGGIYTETILMSGTRDTYSFTVDADALSLAGSALSFQFIANSVTANAGPNQFRVYDFEVTAVPEPSTFALMAGLMTLGLVLYRRQRIR